MRGRKGVEGKEDRERADKQTVMREIQQGDGQIRNWGRGHMRLRAERQRGRDTEEAD